MNPTSHYDEPSDTLYVSFLPGELATGIELNEHILLRVDKAQRRVVGLTFFEYSLLVQKTEVGPRSFPLTGLAELSPELRALALEIITQPPANAWLHLSAYTPSAATYFPIAVITPQAAPVLEAV